MTEDNILEIYSYEDLKKFKTAIDRGEKLDKPKTPKEEAEKAAKEEAEKAAKEEAEKKEDEGEGE